jgi:3-hydroxybutyryl-CoA dehydrogenase
LLLDSAQITQSETALALLPDHPRETHALVVGAGTMGADVAIVLARGGARVTVVDPYPDKQERLVAHVRTGLAQWGLERHAQHVRVLPALKDVDWPGVDLVVECIPEILAAKQALFGQLLEYAAEHTVLTSNSSSFPISRIAGHLASQQRMLGLHFFMPAHLVPLVEVVMGPQTDVALAQRLCSYMRGCGSVPVLVRKDRPGFLANRLQHALAREAFALIDDGVATAEDVDDAVRFGFGFRFLAAGPVLQRDHAGLDVHCAAAATIYPSLCNGSTPARALSERVVAGRLGMKTGGGFYDWPEDRRSAERARYDMLLQQGLVLLADALPPIDGAK